nr:hypothetical protein [Sicyoidochytrium minutum DNA virus]
MKDNKRKRTLNKRRDKLAEDFWDRVNLMDAYEDLLFAIDAFIPAKNDGENFLDGASLLPGAEEAIRARFSVKESRSFKNVVGTGSNEP